MACPVVDILGKKVILLNGYHKPPASFGKTAVKLPKVDSIRKLRECSKQNPDAVAFGYVSGRWMPAA